MALSTLDRARIILDLVKDGDVASEPAYADVDKVGAAIGEKYVQALYAVYGPISGPSGPLEYAALTNQQKGEFYVGRLREWHRDALIQFRVSAAQQQAAASEADTVLGEVTDDLGM